MAKGRQTPTFHHAEEYSKTQGDYAALLSESYDLKPHEWQRDILRDWLAIDESGKLIHSYCVLEVQGKTERPAYLIRVRPGAW